MPNTGLGITYPDSSGHTRLWEHLQTLAQTADAAVQLSTPRGYSIIQPGNSASMTTSAVDLAGLTVDVPTTAASGLLIVTMSLDVNCTAFTSATAFTGNLVVDGVPQAGNIVRTIQANGDRGTYSQSWYVPVGPGTHTIKGQGRISAATLTAITTANSSITVLAVG